MKKSAENPVKSRIKKYTIFKIFSLRGRGGGPPTPPPWAFGPTWRPYLTKCLVPPLDSTTVSLLGVECLPGVGMVGVAVVTPASAAASHPVGDPGGVLSSILDLLWSGVSLVKLELLNLCRVRRW